MSPKELPMIVILSTYIRMNSVEFSPNLGKKRYITFG